MPSINRTPTNHGHRSQPYPLKPTKVGTNDEPRLDREEEGIRSENKPRYHKRWYEARGNTGVVTLISSTGLLFAVGSIRKVERRSIAEQDLSLSLIQVEDYYLKAASVYLKEVIERLNTASPDNRTIDLRAHHPQVISIVLDCVCNIADRFSEIKTAQQYIEVKAFADRFTAGGIADRLQKIRDDVMQSDPLGFMQILVDEAVEFAQAADIKQGLAKIIQDATKSYRNSVPEEIIASRARYLISSELATSGMPPMRSKKSQMQPGRPNALAQNMENDLIDSVRSLVREVQTTYKDEAALNKAKVRMYTSDEMRDVIYALKDQFYITSENHYPARWSSYNESIYGNDITEWDTPAHALPTQIAQALGIPFYRAFTFGLDEVLIGQNFRSGYHRDPMAPAPFHRQILQTPPPHSLQYNENDQPMSESQAQASPTGPERPPSRNEGPFGLDRRSMSRSQSPFVSHTMPTSPPQHMQKQATTPAILSPAPASFASPNQHATSFQLSGNSSTSSYQPANTCSPSEPATTKSGRDPTGRFRTPPNPTAIRNMSGKKHSQPRPAALEVKQEDEMISGSRKDEQEYSGLPLWEDVWGKMMEYIEGELDPGSISCNWDEKEVEEADDFIHAEDDRSLDVDMQEENGHLCEHRDQRHESAF